MNSEDSITVWRVKPTGFGWCYFDELSEALQEAESLLKNGDEVTILPVTMSRREWEEVPEFEGY